MMKKDKEEEEFWPRLLKDKALEKNQVKIDWDRYVDEDEEEEGFDTSAVSLLFVSDDGWLCWRFAFEFPSCSHCYYFLTLR